MTFSLKNESLSYENEMVLHSLNIEIQKGERVALLGKSGSGKSTLLKKLYGLKKEQAAYIPQELSLVENLSAYNNVYIAKLDTYSRWHNLKNLVLPAKKDRDNVLGILQEIDLSEKIDTRVNALSGGEKQRTAIARAIYAQKSVLLADEPISALDEYLSKRVIILLKAHFETIVCALHDVEIATQNFDRVIGLKDSQILLDKRCSDLSEDDIQKLYYVCE